MIIKEDVIEEGKHLRETGIPRCIYCKKNFVNDIDSITRSISKYLWTQDCDCVKHKIGLSIG